MFGPFNIEACNETDVREVIVRPLLHALGYRQGTLANIRTEISFRYGKAFLGRKDPSKDPELNDLRGRADYICDVISYGRWIVEVKNPTEPLDINTSQQAHTYAAHPEVAAIFYLITNGREFKIYRTSFPDEPIFQWDIGDTEKYFLSIQNILSPEAIKCRVFIPVDYNKPLGVGIASSLSIIGGVIKYNEHRCNNLMMANSLDKMNGMRAAVGGRSIERTSDGRIEARLSLHGPYSFFDSLNKLAGLQELVFKTSDEYLSSDFARPTIMQNQVDVVVEKGVHFPMPGLPITSLPFGIKISALTESAGFSQVETSEFVGTFNIIYRMEFTDAPYRVKSMLGDTIEIEGFGEFNLKYSEGH